METDNPEKQVHCCMQEIIIFLMRSVIKIKTPSNICKMIFKSVKGKQTQIENFCPLHKIYLKRQVPEQLKQ